MRNSYESCFAKKKEINDLINNNLQSFVENLGKNLDRFNAARHVLDDTFDAIKCFIDSGGWNDSRRGQSYLYL